MKTFWKFIKCAKTEIVLRGRRTIIALSALVAIELVVIAGLVIGHDKSESGPDVSLHTLKPQTVLYTVYRGHYADLGSAINRLYELAERRGLHPCGAPSMGYLNNPWGVSSDHWLIEVRLPVEARALALAGKLGEMTDVKSLPAMNVAVASKPLGQADPEPVIHYLYSWINKRGYIVAGRLWQSVVCGSAGECPQMSTRFMIPVYSRTTRSGSEPAVRRALPI